MSWLGKFFNFLGRAFRGLRMLRHLRLRHIPQILESTTRRDFFYITAALALILASGSFLIRAYFYTGDGTTPSYGGEHVEGLVGQPRFINPVLAASSSVDSDLARLTYAQLLTYDADLNLQPDLAAALPEVSSDQKTYTLKLKPGLKWQDGTAITAEDVLFTIQTIQDASFESPLFTNWNRVHAEKVDDLTIKFTLHEVSASFITNFAVGILPKHVWGDLSPNNFRLSDNNLQPVGSGPYIVREIKKTSDGTIKSITLKANTSYYQGSPYITYLTFKFYPDYNALSSAYTSKDVTTLGFIPFDKKVYLQSSDRVNQYTLSLPQYQAVFFNLPKNAVLSQLAVRQALWLATDRDNIINDAYLGLAKPAYGPILEGNLGYSEGPKKATHVSTDEANAILEKSGWTIDPDTNFRSKTVTQGKNKVQQPLEFNLVTSSFPLNVKTAQLLASQWAKVGANAHVVIASSSDLQDEYIRPRNFDALLFSENTGADPDPFSFWHSSNSHDPGLNISGFSNATVDKLLTDARQTNDVNVRIKDYAQFQDIVTQQIPAIFLDSAVYVYSTPKKEKGFDLQTIIYPSERFLDVKNWYIATKRK